MMIKKLIASLVLILTLACGDNGNNDFITRPCIERTELADSICLASDIGIPPGLCDTLFCGVNIETPEGLLHGDFPIPARAIWCFPYNEIDPNGCDALKCDSLILQDLAITGGGFFIGNQNLDGELFPFTCSW